MERERGAWGDRKIDWEENGEGGGGYRERGWS